MQYQVRMDDLESKRLGMLEGIGSSDPKEEITFRLNAINTEEQALNQYRDRLLQSQQWLEYLKTSLAAASNANMRDFAFPSPSPRPSTTWPSRTARSSNWASS